MRQPALVSRLLLVLVLLPAAYLQFPGPLREGLVLNYTFSTLCLMSKLVVLI
jgi:hypothetical protein